MRIFYLLLAFASLPLYAHNGADAPTPNETYIDPATAPTMDDVCDVDLGLNDSGYYLLDCETGSYTFQLSAELAGLPIKWSGPDGDTTGLSYTITQSGRVTISLDDGDCSLREVVGSLRCTPQRLFSDSNLRSKFLSGTRR